jgi:hypothetical protein
VVTSPSSFEASNGPQRFTFYTLVLTAISLCATFVFLRFLPASKEECLQWKLKGEALGTSKIRGRIAVAMSAVTILVSTAVLYAPSPLSNQTAVSMCSMA